MNDFREARGLPALKFAPSLAKSSQAYVRHLIRSDRFGHAPSGQAGGGFSSHGEILAYRSGWSLRPAPTLRQWLRSPAHRSLLLRRSFTHAAAAVARGRYGRAMATVSIVQFGTR